MAKKYTFVVSDENVLNSYGFRVMTEGIDISQYEKNPLVLWMHKRPTQWENKNHGKDEIMPIGLASNIRKEDGQLLVDVEFDQNDEFAQKIEAKVEGGFIRMTSAGLDPIATDESEEFLLPGQTHWTLTKSMLEEISIVDIGSNPNALKLAFYNSEKGLITLSKDNVSNYIPKLTKTTTDNQNLNHNTKTNSMDFIQKVAIMLAMNKDASEESITSALKERLELASKANNIQLAHDTLKDQVTKMNEDNIIALVNANQDKKFTADKREKFIKLGKESGYDTLKDMLNLMPDMQKPGNVITLSNNQGGETKVEKFEDLLMLGKEKVEAFRNEQRPEYIKLFKAHYGFEPALGQE